MKQLNTMMGDEEDGTLEVGLLSSASEVSRNPLLILHGIFFALHDVQLLLCSQISHMKDLNCIMVVS
jgi:hypothetical protein